MKKDEVPEWASKGKTISGLIKELETFQNKKLVMFISLDDSNTADRIITILYLEEKCILLSSIGGFNSLELFIDNTFPDQNVHVVNVGECTIQDLINNLRSIKNQSIQVFISNGLMCKSISLVGKGGSGKFAMLKNCEAI